MNDKYGNTRWENRRKLNRFAQKTILVSSTYLHSHRGAQTGEHFYRLSFLFFSFLFFDFRSIQLRWINPWKILNANATIISSTGEYLWQRKGKGTKAPFLPELFAKLFDGFSVGKSRDSFSILPFVKQNEENRQTKKNSQRINSRVLRLNFDLESFSSFRQKKKSRTSSNSFYFQNLIERSSFWSCIKQKRIRITGLWVSSNLLDRLCRFCRVLSQLRSFSIIVVRCGKNHGAWKTVETRDEFSYEDCEPAADRADFASGLSLLLDERHVFGLVSRRHRLAGTRSTKITLIIRYTITLPARTPFSLHVQLWSLTCARLTWNSCVGRCYQSDSFQLSYQLLTVVATSGSLVSDVIFSFLNRRTSKYSRNEVKYFDLTIKSINETNSSRDTNWVRGF